MEKSSRISFYDQIQNNKIKSFILIIIVFAVFLVFGAVIGYVMGPDYFLMITIISIIISILYIWISYYYSDKIALSSVGAKPAERRDYPQFYHSVEGLSLASGMPMPRLFIMEDANINAFATGRNPQNSVICVTTGALKKLNKQELEGVLAHELSHIANYDIRFMTITAIMVGMISILAEIFLRSLWFSGGNDDRDNKLGIILLIVGILLAILAPIVVQLVQLAISRKREYVADASAVKFIRSPTGLIGALKKIKQENEPEKKGRVPKAVASLFISDPFAGMLSTHPPILKRIDILEKM